MSTVPDTQVIVIPSKGDCGLDAAKLNICESVNVTGVGVTPLNGKLPVKRQLLPVADCMLITIAPSCLFKTRLPLVNVVVKICITYVGISKS